MIVSDMTIAISGPVRILNHRVWERDNLIAYMRTPLARPVAQFTRMRFGGTLDRLGALEF